MYSALDDVRESRKIVRVYSGEAERRLPQESEARVLVESLSQHRLDPRDASNPWRKFFEPWVPETGQDPLTDIISVESNRLREKWLSFLNNCPAPDRLSLDQSEPTVEGLVELVKRVAAGWQANKDTTRRGRAMKAFHRFCGTVDSHRTILELLPAGSEYVSIFTGSLNVIVQASVNHESVAEGLSEALCTISEHVVECRAELEIFRTRSMLQLVADFYAHIFVFLSDVMGWITDKRRRRLLDSFNENLSQKFEGQIAKITAKSQMIRNLAAQSARAEQRVARITLEDLSRDVRLGLQGEERRRAEMAYFAEKIEKELAEQRRANQQSSDQAFEKLADRLTQSVFHMLQDKALGWIGDTRLEHGGSPFSQLQYLAVQQPVSNDQTTSAAVMPWTSDSVLTSSKHLEDFFHRDRLRLSLPSGPALVPPGSVGRLSEWMKATSSPFLWLAGEFYAGNELENPLAVLANKVVELADQSHVPVVSYFCELRRERLRKGNDTAEAQACVALLCALLRQMMELLLLRFEASTDLSESRFRLLDGTILSWEEMLKLFHDLLPLMPDKVLCVISGLHWLDDRSTAPYLASLLEALRGSGRVRVLFITNGRSSALMGKLATSETVAVEGNWQLDRDNSWAGSMS